MNVLPTHDVDPQETQEWIEAIEAVIERDGVERAHYLLRNLAERAVTSGAESPYLATTPYINTIPPELQVRSPGNHEIEAKLRALIRWNATNMVVKANKASSELGGHIASFASAATLYDVGFNHFWHAPHEGHGGDLVYIQGHSAPGIYARAFLEGRLTEERLVNFRQESGGKGIPSYPHPWLMPNFWQFPTVSMGLGQITAIYQSVDAAAVIRIARKAQRFAPHGEIQFSRHLEQAIAEGFEIHTPPIHLVVINVCYFYDFYSQQGNHIYYFHLYQKRVFHLPRPNYFQAN